MSLHGDDRWLLLGRSGKQRQKFDRIALCNSFLILTPDAKYVITETCL